MDFLSNPTAGFVAKRKTPVSGERATNKAAQNAATSGNWLDGGNAAGLRITKDDTFIFGGWIKWADSADAIIFTKGDGNTQTNDSYSLFITGASGIITFHTQGATSATDIDANNAIVSGTKAFVLAWGDTTSNNIAINTGTTATKNSLTRTNTADPGGNVTLFSNDDGAGGLGTKCVMDEWFFCKNPSDLSAALNLINSKIYNSGSGTHYDNLTVSDKNTIGLVSWWGLDEASASTRLDLHGSNNLTVNGTITQVTALTA